MSDSETKLRQLGPYLLTRQLGQGTTGTVYLARQESLGRDLAVKVLDPEFSRDAEFVKRFQREGRIAASLRHPNIIQVLDACSSDGAYYIVMEFISGSDLQHLMESPQKPDWRRSVEYGICILDALDHAHRNGVIHRDVKPANVLLNAAGQVILTDFSVAHMKEGTRLTSAGSLLGTPEYMAPEQFDSIDIDGRADIYAASLLLYEMLTGIHPFRAKSMPEIVRAQLFTTPKSPDVLNPEIPRALAEAVMKGLAKKPADRHSKASDMVEILRQVMRDDANPPRNDNPPSGRFDSTSSGRISTSAVASAMASAAHEHMSVLTSYLDVAALAPTSASQSGADAQKELRDRLNYLFRRARAQAMEWSSEGAIVLFSDAAQALKCARNIHQELHNERPFIKLAIASGEIFLDPKYADSRPSLGQFACQTVDNADRMAKECPAGGLLIDPATLPSAPSHMSFKSLGVRPEGLEVFALEDVASTLPAIPTDHPEQPSNAKTIIQTPPAPARVNLMSSSEETPPANPFTSGPLPPVPPSPAILNNPFASGQLPPIPTNASGQLPPVPQSAPPLNNPFASGQLPPMPSASPFSSGPLPPAPPSAASPDNPFSSGQASNPFASVMPHGAPYSSGQLPPGPASPPAPNNPFASGSLPPLPPNPFASAESESPRATSPFSGDLPPLPPNPFGSGSIFPPREADMPPPPPLEKPKEPSAPTPNPFVLPDESKSSGELEPPKRKATLARVQALPDKQPQLTLAFEEPSRFTPRKIVAGLLVVGGLGFAAVKFWPSSNKPTTTTKTTTGAIILKCEPDKVDVSIDKAAKKPFQKGARFDLAPGAHTVEVSAKGFKKFTQKITVKVGAPVDFKVKLQPEGHK